MVGYGQHEGQLLTVITQLLSQSNTLTDVHVAQGEVGPFQHSAEATWPFLGLPLKSPWLAIFLLLSTNGHKCVKFRRLKSGNTVHTMHP